MKLDISLFLKYSNLFNIEYLSTPVGVVLLVSLASAQSLPLLNNTVPDLQL
ncbi:hypothetical protein [Paraclostridium dentum]|uniref:hypothetical protein n=1 Tax=Paraclostridium dentum TaxID=2662455 RepID=UPI003F2D84AC